MLYISSSNIVLFLLLQADADGLCTVLGDPFTKDEVDRPLSQTIDRSVFEQAGWLINRDDITVRVLIFEN
jgi:hypothetical protein